MYCTVKVAATCTCRENRCKITPQRQTRNTDGSVHVVWCHGFSDILATQWWDIDAKLPKYVLTSCGTAHRSYNVPSYTHSWWVSNHRFDVLDELWTILSLARKKEAYNKAMQFFPSDKPDYDKWHLLISKMLSRLRPYNFLNNQRIRLPFNFRKKSELLT